jgi:uncharacterized membrane protein YhaH (DUF805 family)
MDPIDLLFGYRGRVNRAKYWLALLIWLVIWAAVVILIVMSGISTMAIVIAVIVAIPAIYSGVVVGIKRLHDRNKSGLWLLVFYLAPSLLDAIGRGLDGIGMVFSLASLAVTIWAIVELGCLRGSIGNNPYGPDPVAPRPAHH